MTLIADPHDNPEAWGQVLVSGTKMPGVLTRIGVPDRVYEYAIEKGFGFAGKAVIWRSTEVLDGVEFEYYIEPGKYAETEAFMRLLIPGWPKKYQVKPKAFSWVHPALQFLGFDRGSIKAYGPPREVTLGAQDYYHKFTIIEYSPQNRVATGPPEPAKINGPPTPKDALETAVLAAFAEFTQ